MFNLLRALILLLGVYTVFYGIPFIGIFIIITAFFSLLFKLRNSILLKPSKQATLWELIGILLILFNALAITFNTFDFFIHSDSILHFWGGLFVAMYAMQLKIKQTKIEKLLFILGVVALVSVIWEFWEWGMDYFLTSNFNLQPFQPSLDDTMFDLLMDLLGGMLIIFLYKIKKKV